MFHSDFLNSYIRKYSAPINYLIRKQALEPLFPIRLVITMIQISTIIISNTSYVKSATMLQHWSCH